MIRSRHRGFGACLAVVTLAGWVAAGVVFAGPPPLPTAPPPLPTPKSPVDFFRELLVMTGPERRRALTNRPPEVRTRVLAKLQEYELMPEDLRELRLRATELRWYLVPLMKMATTERTSLASIVPSHLRQLVADRLERWDLLPPGARSELLENELALDYFTQAGAPDVNARLELPKTLSPTRREELAASLQRWEAMPADERRRLFERVKGFFDLTPKEQEKAKATLSATDRERMEETLGAFAKLSHEQRSQCIRSFDRFAGLSAAERQQFLQNAARWSAMSYAERETWRNLVRRLPEMPPFPPDYNNPPPPPLPRTAAPRSRAIVTNGS